MKQETAYLHTEATNIFIFVRNPREHHVWKAWRVEVNVDARGETAEETLCKILTCSMNRIIVNRKTPCGQQMHS